MVDEGKQTTGRAARLARVQARHPLAVVGVGLLLLVGSLPLIGELGLDSSFAALLPEHADAVRDLELIGDRIGGTSSLFVVLQADDPDVMKETATDLVERLEASEDPAILRIDWNVHDYEEFVEANKHLWLDVDVLEQTRDDLAARLDAERAAANPFHIDLDEEDDPPELEAIAERARESSAGSREQLERFDEGFYVHPDGDLLVFFIRTEIASGDVAPSEQLIARVEEHIAALPDRGVSITLAGDVVESLEENRAITEELIIATSLTIVLVLGAIFVFFRRIEAIPILGTAVAVPVAVTFALAELQVDYLNTSTAFLGAIVIGNGVNPNIMWLARYFEERRLGKTIEGAIASTHRGVWAATLTASLAAGVAYASLVLTDFRGYRDFGIIGFTGMATCWLGSMGLLPAVVATVERFSPMAPRKPGKKKSAPYGLLFARLVERAPKTILAISAITGMVSVGVVSQWILADPLEYDINNIRSVRKETQEAALTNDRINEFVSRTATGTNIAMLVPDRSQVPNLEAELERRRDEGEAVYGQVSTIEDLLPENQEAKLPILADIRETMLELRDHADDEQRELLDEWMPPEEPHVLGDEDLPDSVAALFSERDGTLGRVVFIEQRNDFDNWNGRYLVQWAADVRAVKAADGQSPPLTGRPVVFADVLAQIWEDGPLAIAASFLATVILLMIGFRGFRQRFFTLLALLLGISWMGATMAIAGMKLNFLNFVAFPITFGNGVDYGVNVMRRFDVETRGGTRLPDAVRRSIVESGGAVILCSLTTIIGYMSLYSSANRSINSFGAAMAISEVTCVIAAVLTMPALLMVLGARGADPAKRAARRVAEAE